MQFIYCTDVKARKGRRYKSTHYTLRQYLKLSSELHAAAKLPLVHFYWNNMCAAGPVCITSNFRRSNFIFTAGIQTTNPHHAVQSLYSHCNHFV
jgi:hypothetical protein